MKVGEFQIGRYHAIIRKNYADGSVDYETSFSDQASRLEDTMPSSERAMRTEAWTMKRPFPTMPI